MNRLLASTNLINKLKISQQIGLGFLVAIIFLIAMALMGVFGLSTSNQSLHAVYEDRVVPLRGLKTIADAYAVNVIDATNKANAGILTAESASEALHTARAVIDSEWPAFMATRLTDEEARLASDAEMLFLPADKELGAVLQELSAKTGLVAGQLDSFVGPLYSSIDPISGKIGELIELQLREARLISGEADQRFHRNLILTGILVVIALFTSVTAGLTISRGISRPMQEAVALTQAVASGDLSREIEVHSNNEIGQLLAALREMNEKLSSIVSEVRMASESVASGAEQIAAGTLDLSQRTEEQASNVQETAASMEEMMATVNQNAETAAQVGQLAQEASKAADHGGEVVGRVITTMQAISESSKEMADIIATIDSIAFQTNILALNASVEAARAGEQGRGFAVVAEEVRNLAQRSASAAQDIKTLINKSLGTISTGSELVSEAGESVHNIVNQVSRVNQLVVEITAATKEQSLGIGQVGEAVTQIDQMTQQNAELVEESSAAAESMKAQASLLTSLVRVFVTRQS